MAETPPFQLAFAAVPQGGGIRRPAAAESLTPGPMAGQALAAPALPHAPAGQPHAAHKRPGPVDRVSAPLPIDGVRIGYERLFPAPASHQSGADAAEPSRSAANGREPAIWTVFNGPGQARPARALGAEQRPGLLLALRAGF